MNWGTWLSRPSIRILRKVLRAACMTDVSVRVVSGRVVEGRWEADVVLAALALPTGPFAVVEVDAAIAAQVRVIPRVENADPGDRIIVATAEVLGVPLVSADGKVPTMTSRSCGPESSGHPRNLRPV